VIVVQLRLVDLTGLAEIHSLWIGQRLSWIELVSIHSWLEHGHPVTLSSYEQIEGVPNAVCIADAAMILPSSSIIRHRAVGSFALFANRFRYHLLNHGPVTWLDLDMVLLRPLSHTSPSIWLRNANINLQRRAANAPEVARAAGSYPPDGRAHTSTGMVAAQETSKTAHKRADRAPPTCRGHGMGDVRTGSTDILFVEAKPYRLRIAD
jgi:hypothetical protein